MSVSPTTNSPATNGASSSNSSNTKQSTIGLTSNQFLTLLATQLRNQNPLNPTDPNQFTSQMVQYANLSQQIDMNQSLGGVNTSLGTMSTTMSDILTKVSQLASAGDKTQTQSS